MTANEYTPATGEKHEVSERKVATFLSGVMPFEVEPEVRVVPGEDGLVELALRGQPQITVVLTPEQARSVSEELAAAAGREE